MYPRSSFLCLQSRETGQVAGGTHQQAAPGLGEGTTDLTGAENLVLGTQRAFTSNVNG